MVLFIEVQETMSARALPAVDAAPRIRHALWPHPGELASSSHTTVASVATVFRGPLPWNEKNNGNIKCDDLKR